MRKVGKKRGGKGKGGTGLKSVHSRKHMKNTKIISSMKK